MIMSVSAALVYSFIIFVQFHDNHSGMRWTSRFTSVFFGSTHPFKIPRNSHDVFLHYKTLGPGLYAA